ncbi:MAG: hypothetical protein JW840_04235 [Candidatus Thermoplasmatota archaeon]|nr:hypothetical protein [Candidatus Thermoplasmatota archaeon]
MAKRQKMWGHKTPKQPKPKVPDTIKLDVEAKARELVDTVLKPEHIKAPSGNKPFNYIVDIYTEWYQNYFYFCSKYACPGPNAISPYFEAKFARLEYVGNDRFNLSYMRHTEKWWEIYFDLSLDECIAAIRDESLFAP